MLEHLKILNDKIGLAVIFPIVTVVCLFIFFLYYRRVSLPLAGTTEWITRIIDKPKRSFALTRYPMEKCDILPLAVIVAVFTFLALFELGDRAAPQSFHTFSQEKPSIVIELDEMQEISSLMFYTGLWTGHYTLELSEDGLNWQEQHPKGDNEFAMNQPHSHLFKWRYADLNDDNLPWIKYIRITASRSPLMLGELAVYGPGGAPISAAQMSFPDSPQLFDEQKLVPEKPTYMNSMYFDEIYHGRTALEHLLTIADNPQAPEALQSIYPYETTHPPLGKLIIAVGIEIFGMTPFGWRFMGAIFGVAMLAVLYILLKNMFGKTVVAICGTLLLGFDFMRFVQTRIATIDTYGVFFILLAYLFMYRYLTADIDEPASGTFAPLALSGVFFGIGCASKWIVVYAGLGLAVIYLIRLVSVGRYYSRTGEDGFAGYLTKTLLWSVLFFVAVPVVIYCLSYIPYGLARGMTTGKMLVSGDFYRIIWDNQKSMFSYHGDLVAEHAYASRWYQWLVDGRPILYYREYSGGNKSAFAAFGNPVVWWGGLLAMIAMAVRIVKYRDGNSLFIIIGYLSQLLPWLFISRIVFIYHYFPSTLFLVLAAAHVFNTIIERRQRRYRHAVYGFTAASGVLFFVFYPAITGVYAPQWYFQYILRWIPGAWPL